MRGKRPALHTAKETPVILMAGTLFRNEGSITVRGVIEGVFCPLVVDTGANVTVVRPDVLDTQTLSRLQASTSLLKTATGKSTDVRGKLILLLKLVEHKYCIT